jgi:hemolysin activation/secretion protein
MLRNILATIVATLGIVITDCLNAIATVEPIPKITIHRVQLDGNTVFSDQELESIIRPWLNQPVEFAQLQEIRDTITEHYYKAGYLTSFALLPPEHNQQLNADAATITIQIVEGTIAAVTATNPTPRTQAIAQQLPQAQIFNQQQLLAQLQFLRLEPGIRDLQAELLPTQVLGRSHLRLNIQPAPQFEIVTGINNQNSADTGKLQRGVNFQWLQPLNLGDRLTGNFHNTNGGNNWGLGYQLALNPSTKTQVGIDYRHLNQRVIRAPFDAIDIRTKASALNFHLNQVMLQQAERDTLRAGKIGATLSLVNSRSFILDRPFPLNLESSDEGQLKFAALRFFQEYQQRSATTAFSVRSQFNLGLPGSTTGANGVDGQFFSWQGQALLNQATAWGQLGFRLTGQFSNDRLPSYEQINAAGIRGYAADFLPSSKGLMLCNELKIPLQNANHGLFITPFFDVGILGNQRSPSQLLTSGGLGLEWLTSSGFSAQISYEIPFIQNNFASWQDPQLNFSVQFKSSF